MNDDHFRSILEWFDLSWMGYRKVRRGAKKRLTRHMQQLGCRSVEDYLSLLEKHPDLQNDTLSCLSITISRFMRDKKLWQDLHEYIFPKLIQHHTDPLRIWSAGCSCGEEAYSFAIVWDQFQKHLMVAPELEIIASDTNHDAIDRAKKGEYSKSALKEIRLDVLKEYFIYVPQRDQFLISDDLKRYIRWVHHDFCIEEPPARDYQVVFLRNNLLTYYQRTLYEPALRSILQNLSEHGWLIIGSHEIIPEGFPCLKQSRYNPMIYCKLQDSKGL